MDREPHTNRFGAAPENAAPVSASSQRTAVHDLRMDWLERVGETLPQEAEPSSRLCARNQLHAALPRDHRPRAAFDGGAQELEHVMAELLGNGLERPRGRCVSSELRRGLRGGA